MILVTRCTKANLVNTLGFAVEIIKHCLNAINYNVKSNFVCGNRLFKSYKTVVIKTNQVMEVKSKTLQQENLKSKLKEK